MKSLKANAGIDESFAKSKDELELKKRLRKRQVRIRRSLA